jgi:RNA polymerase sigma-70 factor (ECF subfamily)
MPTDGELGQAGALPRPLAGVPQAAGDAPAEPAAADRRSVLRERFARLARENETALLRTAQRMCRGDDDRAADLVQDSLVGAYEAYLRGGFAEGTNARAWLLRILINRYINDYRRRSRWEAGIDVETLTRGGETGPAVTHAAPADMPGVSLLTGTLDEEIEQALAALSEPLRMCIMLVDIEGLEYAEAAAALGIPIGTVRSRLSRARMALHDLLLAYARKKRYVTT